MLPNLNIVCSIPFFHWKLIKTFKVPILINEFFNNMPPWPEKHKIKDKKIWNWKKLSWKSAFLAANWKSIWISFCLKRKEIWWAGQCLSRFHVENYHVFHFGTTKSFVFNSCDSHEQGSLNWSTFVGKYFWVWYVEHYGDNFLSLLLNKRYIYM